MTRDLHQVGSAYVPGALLTDLTQQRAFTGAADPNLLGISLSVGDQWLSTAATDILPNTPYVVRAGQDIQTTLNAAPAGATVLILKGTYSLAGKQPLSPQANQVLYFQTGAVLDGAAPLSGWTSDGAGHWYATGFLPPAYSDSGQCEINSGSGANPCQQREWVFANGQHLTRYMNLTDLKSGGFFSDYAANRVWVADDPSSRAFVISTAQYAINSYVNGVELRGVTVQHFATPSQLGAVTVHGTDWNIHDCTFQWNHAIGLHLDGSHRTWVHNIKASYNGQLGMGHHACNNTVIEDNEFGYNNTDGYWGADWESGGFKATFSQNMTIRRCWSHHNRGVGVWFDIDNLNCTIGGAVGNGNVIEYNYADGIRWEISFTCNISYNTIRWNGYGLVYDGGRGSDYSMLAVAAVNINSSPDVEIHHNTIANNANGVCGQMRNRGNSATFGTPRDLHNLYVHDNDITQKVVTYTDPTGVTHQAGADRGLGEGVTGVRVLQVDTSLYFSATKNNRFTNNRYHLDSTTAKRFAWNQSYMSFANFQAAGVETSGSVTTS